MNTSEASRPLIVVIGPEGSGTNYVTSALGGRCIISWEPAIFDGLKPIPESGVYHISLPSHRPARWLSEIEDSLPPTTKFVAVTREKYYAVRSAHRRFGNRRSHWKVEEEQYDRAIDYIATLKRRFQVHELCYSQLGCPNTRKEVEEFVGFKGCWPVFVNRNDQKGIKSICYCLTNRGLFSELNNLLNGYYFALRNGCSFTVDDTHSSLYFSEGFECYFNAIGPRGGPTDGPFAVIRGNSTDRIKPPSGFRNVRSLAEKELTFEMKRLLVRVLTYTDSTARQIETIVKSLKLPANYSCLHVRWGDKVGDRPLGIRKFETTKRPLDDYFEALPKNVRDLFIMSDDYAAIEHAKEYIKKNNLRIKVHTLCTRKRDGHSTIHRVTTQEFFARNELITLFAECEIAKKATCFVCTMSSNIARYIKLIHDDPSKCISLDIDWHPC